MIADLLKSRLVTVAGVSSRVSPNLRRGGTQSLPCVVYEIESDEPLVQLGVALEFSHATCTIHCLATTLAESVSVANDVAQGIHAASWTHGTAAVLRARVLSSASSTIDDSDSGAHDQTRDTTVRAEIWHKL